MVKLCSPILLRFLATPLRHSMYNKYYFHNISLVIWVQNLGKIVDENIPPVKMFYFSHCLRLRDVKTFSSLESQILIPRGPASYLCPGARIFSRRPCLPFSLTYNNCSKIICYKCCNCWKCRGDK